MLCAFISFSLVPARRRHLDWRCAVLPACGALVAPRPSTFEPGKLSRSFCARLVALGVAVKMRFHLFFVCFPIGSTFGLALCFCACFSSFVALRPSTFEPGRLWRCFLACRVALGVAVVMLLHLLFVCFCKLALWCACVPLRCLGGGSPVYF